MANAIKRIEKDFFLKVLYDEQTPLVYIKNRTEYTLILERPPKDQVFLKSNQPIEDIKPHSKLSLIFDYQGQSLSFTIDVVSIKEDIIVGDAPEFLYRNLERSFSRTQLPQDLQVQFTLSGERYSLACPRVQEYNGEDSQNQLKNLNINKLGGLLEQLKSWLKENVSAHSVVFYKDANTASTEERIIADTGKMLYIPSTQGPLPKSDPYPNKKIITEEMFRHYLESTGIEQSRADAAVAAFLKAKFDAGIISEAWVPIIFHEFAIGYIYVWINTKDKKPLNFSVIDTLYQFAAILVYSLKEKGYFEKGKIENSSFESKIIDISVSGLSFACSHSSPLARELTPGKEISVNLISPKRSVAVNSKIVRHYKDKNQAYFGCHFEDMEPEDTRFLFEYLYGKTFSDDDITLISGQV